jgi:hypothetical protein
VSKTFPRRLPGAAVFLSTASTHHHGRELCIIQPENEKKKTSIITRDTDILDIEVCPSYDCGDEEYYQKHDKTSKEDFDVEIKQSLYKYSIFECDNCGVEFRGLARPLLLENMPCYRCGQKTAGFKARCSQGDEDDDE